jgi:hypothetical protein
VPLSFACSEDILGMEKQMLATLQYDLTVPTCYLFNARFRKAAGVQDDLKVGTVRCTLVPLLGMCGCACCTLPSLCPGLRLVNCPCS